MDWQPRQRRRRRHQRVRWGRVLVVLLGLIVAIYGLIRLISYGVDLLSSRRTAQDLRELYYAAPTLEPSPVTAAPSLTPRTNARGNTVGNANCHGCAQPIAHPTPAQHELPG